MRSNSTVLLDIPHSARAHFKERPNRYLGIVELGYPESARDIKAHIHDPGRLVDLLYPGNDVLLRYAASAHRKTEWDILASRWQDTWILVHSGYHRKIAEQILGNADLTPFKDIARIQAEVTYGRSRVDFLIEDKFGAYTWIEVKGCTHARGNTALFPDAPTKRGRKHLNELIAVREMNQGAALLILVFRPDANLFAANREIDPDFADLFAQAANAGVEIIPIRIGYDGEKIRYEKRIEFELR
ncbi:DNA/RNA nuclease SfsA [candidate division KSB1 bacterium]|nr:DNA/RNA nuclease SfsA [candidate division KSB1 bacterium]